MNRFNAIAITCAAVLVACGGNGGTSKPTINAFSAIPTAILVGETSALSWDVTGATSLTIDQGVGTVTGTAVAVTPGATKTYTLTATNSNGSATATATVTVSAAAKPQAGFSVAASSNSVAAGTAVTITITAIDTSGVTATSYAGTVHVTSTDSQIAAQDVTFAAADHGVKTATVTPKTAGTTGLFVKDASQLSGSAELTVGPASPNHCIATGAPASARAGDALPVRVAVFDQFGNSSTNYTGTVTLTSSDALASLPAPHTFGASDNGAHDFSVRLGTLGADSVSSGDGTLSCNGLSVTISAGPASQLSLAGIASAVIAGTAQSFTVSAFDAYGNAATDYAGPVALSSTDGAATYTDPGGGFSGGQKSFQVAFATIGAQTVTATDNTGFAGSHGPVGVHGLVYTPAGSNGQPVSLNLNATSNAGLVVLDLVATTAITGYSVGMNIPADGSRVGIAGIAKGTALDPGRAPAAIAVALPSAGPLTNVLTSGLSQKLGGAGAVTSDASISGGQVLYTLSLNPTSVSPGVIFDGSQNFRAAIRNLAGDELLSQADFAVGKLELQ
jgi:hypothetical protein